jgi:hypothetical protein
MVFFPVVCGYSKIFGAFQISDFCISYAKYVLVRFFQSNIQFVISNGTDRREISGEASSRCTGYHFPRSLPVSFALVLWRGQRRQMVKQTLNTGQKLYWMNRLLTMSLGIPTFLFQILSSISNSTSFINCILKCQPKYHRVS